MHTYLHAHASQTHSQASNITQVALFFHLQCFHSGPENVSLRSTMESAVDETCHLSFQTAGSGALII